MNHTTAKDFDPAGTFTETAAFSAAFEAGNINLCTWLCKWEVMWSEFCFGFWSEKLFRKYFKSSFQVCERNIFIYYKALNLMEGWRMSCIYFIRTEYSSRCDHTDRQLSFFHGTCLNRRCLGTKKYGIIDKESILLVSCRMILRNIQLGKVVICIFNFRTFYNFIAHSNKNALNLFQRNAVGMTMTDSGFLCR